MTYELQLLDDTVGSMLDRHVTRELRRQADRALPAALWKVLDDSGLTTLGMPEGGGGLPELVVLARAVGRAAAPVPLVEMSGLACWLLACADLPLPDGLTTCTASHPQDDLVVTRAAEGWSVRGTLHRVPWGEAADQTVALGRGDVGLMTVVLRAPSRVQAGRNHAGEPRDTLVYDDVVVPDSAAAPAGTSADELLGRGALLRSASMAGAMEQVLEMTLSHTRGREQFGKPLSSFQAVQHHLVAIAAESACASMAVRAASVLEGPRSALAVASAKATAGRAAQVVTARAHQVHGAIGATREHDLHWYTSRLWSWQDEFGTGQSWAGRIGADVLRADPAGLWRSISAAEGDHVPEAREAPAFAGQT